MPGGPGPATFYRPGGPGPASFEADGDSIVVSYVRPAPDRARARPYRQARIQLPQAPPLRQHPDRPAPCAAGTGACLTDNGGATRTGLPHPGQPTADNGGTYDVSARRQSAAIRWLMRARVHGASAAVRLRCQCRGAEAAQHDCQNENSARPPGAGRPPRGFTASAAHRSDGPHDDMP